MDTIKPDRLLVPTAKELGAPPPAPVQGAADHFKCYKVEISEGAPGFQKRHVMVEDQVETRLYEVLRPVRLCLPVDKNASGVQDPSGHLMCYKVKIAKRQCAPNAPENPNATCKVEEDCGGRKRVTAFCVRQAKHERVAGEIHTNNQFGPLRLDTIAVDSLCVPATKD